MDRSIEAGLTKKEVLRIFPEDVLVKKKYEGDKCKYRMHLKSEWENSILDPFAWGGTNYSICFDNDGKVIDTELILGGDE